MKICIVYYSRTNRTRYISESLNKTLQNSDLFEIFEKNAGQRYGIIGFIKTIFDSLTQKKSEIKKLPINISDYDFIILVTPIWAGKISLPMKSFLENNLEKFDSKKIILLTTSSSKNKTISNFEKIFFPLLLQKNFSNIPSSTKETINKFSNELNLVIDYIKQNDV